MEPNPPTRALPTVPPPPVPPPSGPPPIDRSTLVARCLGDADFACLILGKFQERAGEMVAAVERAVTAGDAVAARRAAHALKGAAANLSAEGVRAVTEAIEQDGDAAAAAAHLVPLRAAVEQCLAYIPVLTAALKGGQVSAA